VKRLLIRGGRIVDPANRVDAVGDLLIEGDRIAAVGDVGYVTADAVIDARGMLVAPGLVDMHTHLREPGTGEETIASGAAAAVSGGVTTLACMADTEPALDNEAAAEYLILQGKRAGLANVLPIGAVTRERKGTGLSEMGGLARAGAVAFSDDPRPVEVAEMMRRALLYAQMFDRVIISHCEDRSLSGSGVMNAGPSATRLGLPGIPNAAEEIVIARDITLARITGGKLHVAHVSTEGAVDLLRKAKAEGVAVTAEVTPHHLTLTEEAVFGFDANFKVSPPLRTRRDIEALVRGIETNVIDVIASDHSPRRPESKVLEFGLAPAGAIGLETLFPVIYTEIVHRRGLPLPLVLEKLTSSPARILQIDRGTLGPGRPADVAVFDIDTDWTIDPSSFRSLGRNTPFAGWKVRGMARHVIAGGRCVLGGPEGKTP